jgi:hypothetical protein
MEIAQNGQEIMRAQRNLKSNILIKISVFRLSETEVLVEINVFNSAKKLFPRS